MRKMILAGIALLSGIGATATAQSAPADIAPKNKIKTLIVTGQDGSHWWQGGSEALEMTLKNSGLFSVEVATTPPSGGDMTAFAPDFARYDLVVINYGGDTWAPATRKAFERFVKRGGGVAIVHSSIVPMADWREYNVMTGLGGWGGRDETSGPWVYWKDSADGADGADGANSADGADGANAPGGFVKDNAPGEAGFHTLQHPFTVIHRAPEHPILKGLPTEWLHVKDELYGRARGPAQNMEVLATAWDDPSGGGTGRHEPMLWTVRYGRGRVFVTAMGHAGNDPDLRYSMECAGFQETLLRGAEWAATGAVTRPVPADLPTETAAAVRPDFKTLDAPVNPAPKPVSVHWKPRTLTVTNTSGAPLASGWQLWYNGPISRLERPADSPVKVVSNGTLVKIFSTDHYRPLLHGESLEIPLSNSDYFVKNQNVPEGMFFVPGGERGKSDPDGKEGKGGPNDEDGKGCKGGPCGQPVPIEPAFTPIPTPNNGRALYERNLDAAPVKLAEFDILPTPKKIEEGAGATVLKRSVAIEFPTLFASEAGFLAEKLAEDHGADVSATTADAGATRVIFVHRSELFAEPRPEGYRIDIVNGAVIISAADAAGAFYGAQTLLNILKNHTLPTSLSNVAITDWPDFGFRGQHFDIARNYNSPENVLRVVDLFASYKINTLHWHFSDDEGWRLEIPGLPELTEIGARRGYTPDESDMLVPAYNGGADPIQGTGSGHLTREQFIELLQYAARRHIKVIPEIESPGHARAARVAMNARYHKYIATDPAKATEFLLDDFDDRSVYNSAQDYGDNVMNVALPSTYRFMEKVIDEIAAMYAEAGVPFDVVHIGGDEVPHGSWTGSPIAQKFMAENGIPDATALGEYYILRVNELLKARGIKMAGWQELVEGRSEAFRAAVKDNLGYVNCWSTNGRQAETPYRLANLGYPVVLSNVGNFYMDLAYSDHPDERGLGWGGYVDDQRAFSMQPWNIYSSVRRDDAGRPVDNSGAGEGLTKLTPEGAKSVLGLQGQLWAETLRSFDGATYLLFPKMLGLAQRAWNSSPGWGNDAEGQAAFLADYSRFNAIATGQEMPWLAGRGVDFRLPPPGIYIENGILYANSSIPAAEIRYTTDGSTPTAASTLWTGPVECNAAQVTARLFYLGHESVSAKFVTPTPAADEE